jgi:hypothetical protein
VRPYLTPLPPPTTAWIRSHACVKPYLLPIPPPPPCAAPVQGSAGPSRLYCPDARCAGTDRFCRTGAAYTALCRPARWYRKMNAINGDLRCRLWHCVLKIGNRHQMPWNSWLGLLEFCAASADSALNNVIRDRVRVREWTCVIINNPESATSARLSQWQAQRKLQFLWMNHFWLAVQIFFPWIFTCKTLLDSKISFTQSLQTYVCCFLFESDLLLYLFWLVFRRGRLSFHAFLHIWTSLYPK